jgi:hypothetical protein
LHNERKVLTVIKKTVIIINIFILTTAFYLFSGCQSRSLTRADKHAEVDSSLYFEQVKQIEDPFYSSVTEHENQTITLKKTVIPEEGVVSKKHLKEVEGFRVQVFASVDSINALNTLYNCKALVSDSLYLIGEKGLYKVQVGDYQFRPQADSVNTILKNNGYSGAWVVRRIIFIPVSIALDEPVKSSEEKIGDNKLTASGKYNIQIIATLSEEKARLIINDIHTSKKYNAYYVKSGEIFKVFVGPFQNEAHARSVLQEVKKSGYPDAWLVY